ncbi:general secretion pathway protein GspB [Alteromonas lipolytica]|uniref:Type II secretion system protein GspB C-terminal domain-containing protein n=1 Tax=Alteromonas lipolytica TaxID=1856405 RepID=A0A1E8F9N9_9ALTE|nr:general secretion pathway protein GspB [Alteromonas lipolytica]OFI32619.1 hypothetical protein BFC17_05550 [Alteromonas lipolytica]GGF74645.1 hypothetical protein GCM10011338_28350 [Alteromonas lipolytica]
MTQIIPIDQAQPGMMIVRVTAQNGPVRINKSGLITSGTMIQGLIEMGVQEIEYDPEQTVEICADETYPASEQTPTQALLRGQYDTRAQKTDSAISDQFNRSLFLPTVNGLPGQWRRALKPALIGMLMAIGGTATGYTLAVLPATITGLLNPPASPPPLVTTTPQPAPVQQDTSPAEQAAGPSVQEANSPDTAQNEPSQIATTKAEPEPESTPVEADDTREVEVSPELMARFNKVLTDLENEEERGTTTTPDTVVNVHDDIQRVDQLPARLLTRLPAMDFSAHMYASNPRDRWVRVNGEDKVEGDWIADRVQIVNIEAQRVILRFEGEVFSMTALTDW